MNHIHFFEEKLPKSLKTEAKVIRQCLDAFDRAMPVDAVFLFGSHARGDSRQESDVDLCIVSSEADNQTEASVRLRRATREIRGKPPFTLIPISPRRLEEKRRAEGHFFRSILNEAILIGAQDGFQ